MIDKVYRNMAPEESRKWFREAKFGMFIHWGLYSLLGRGGAWAMHNERIPDREYAPLADSFNPKKFEPDAWAGLAKDTGMKYMVFTTRHHDGFSLYDSKADDFTSVRTRAGRDFVAEYVKACRRAGLRVGFYYSLLDWRFRSSVLGQRSAPRDWERMVQFAHEQVRELMTNYGRIDILWYDAGGKGWRSRKLNAMVRRLQPHILINNRSGTKEDFITPEQKIEVPPKGQLWETCMTLNDSWAYNKGDLNWKNAYDLEWNLAICAHNGGNFLLNVAPRADGTFPPKSVALLKSIGRWMRIHAEAIHGTVPYPFNYCDKKITTARGNTAYLFLHPRNHPRDYLVFTGIANRVRTVRLMDTGEKLKVTHKENKYLIWLPRLDGKSVHVLKVLLDSAPEGVPWRP